MPLIFENLAQIRLSVQLNFRMWIQVKLNSGKIFRQEEKLPFSASETFFEELRKHWRI